MISQALEDKTKLELEIASQSSLSTRSACSSCAFLHSSVTLYDQNRVCRRPAQFRAVANPAYFTRLADRGREWRLLLPPAWETPVECVAWQSRCLNPPSPACHLEQNGSHSGGPVSRVVDVNPIHFVMSPTGPALTSPQSGDGCG